MRCVKAGGTRSVQACVTTQSVVTSLFLLAWFWEGFAAPTAEIMNEPVEGKKEKRNQRQQAGGQVGVDGQGHEKSRRILDTSTLLSTGFGFWILDWLVVRLTTGD